jgi:hypothetical protein
VCERETHFILFWHDCYDDGGDDSDIDEDSNDDQDDDSNSNVCNMCVCVFSVTDSAPAPLTISMTYLAVAELWNVCL